MLSGNGPKLHRKFLKAAYLVQFYLYSLFEKLLRVPEKKDLGVVISDKLT